MKKKIKIIISILMMFIYFLQIEYVYAENSENTYKDNSISQKMISNEYEVTTLDEDGNVNNLYDIEKSMTYKSAEIDKKGISINGRTNSISNNSIAVVNFRTKASSRENTSYNEVGTNREGYTNGYYAADGAFLGYDNESSPTKVKFMQSGVIGWVNINEVQVLNYTSNQVKTLSKYYVSNGRLYHGISTDLSNTAYSSKLDCGPKPSYLKNNTDYYSYDGHYFYETSSYSSYEKMIKDYRNNIRTNSVNPNNPYYNYYQYLSHRSITTYNSKQINQAISNFSQSSSKMRDKGDSFVSNQNLYGTNALLMIGVAANESAWGSSNIAQTKNNLFGHSAYDKDPNGSANKYSSVDYSIYYHSAMFLSKGYCDPITDSRYYGTFLGDKASGICVKYASDPYWGEKAASVCWLIDNYLGGTDSGKYTIGIKDTFSNLHNVANIKASPNNNSTTLYSTYPVSSKSTYKNSAPSNFAFIILRDGANNGYYKIQSDGSIDLSRNKINVQSEYFYNTDYAYVDSNNIRVVNQGYDSSSQINTSNVEGQPTGKGEDEPTLYYQSKCQNTDWLYQVNEPNTTGTTGRALNLYQLKLDLRSANPTAYLSGAISNTTGLKKYNNVNKDTIIGDDNCPMQIINFSANYLTGYKLQYRVHSAEIGWQSWVDEGNNAGIAGKNIQAIDFRIVADDDINRFPSVYYSQHLSDIGWTANMINGDKYGNVTKNLEAFKIGIENLDDYSLTVKTIDEQNNRKTYAKVDNTTIIGTSGQSLGLKMINMTLINNCKYELEYRAYIDEKWTNWISQGNDCGSSTTGVIKDIQIKVKYVSHITSICFEKSDICLQRGTTETLKVIFNPVDTTDNKSLTWISSNPTVATVDKNGVVNALTIGETIISAESINGKIATCKVNVTKQIPTIEYQTHVEDIGWQKYVKEGNVAGTSGQSKRLEAIKIKLNNNSSYKGTLQYRTHIQDIGWQEWKTNDQISGTNGQSKRLEAIQIKLTDELEGSYDIYYRVHAEDYGWLDWAKNGESSGTEGLSKRLEAIEIKMIDKGAEAPGSTLEPFVQINIEYQTHIQNEGWQEIKFNGIMSGTSGKALRLEGIKINLANQKVSGDIKYQTHVQDIGWQSWKTNGQISGTIGESKRLEAIKLELTGDMANIYDIYYRAHSQEFGWLGWAKNGESAGTEGYSYRLEGIEIKLVMKNKNAPGSILNSFFKR